MIKTTPPRIVTCPNCKAPVPWTAESRFRPFCSARCRGIDLGAWASDTYRVAGQEEPLGDGEPSGPN